MLLKTFKKGMPIWKSKVPSHVKGTFTKFLDMQKEDKRVKLWWFNSKARELMKEKYLDEASFKILHRWFEGFL